MDLGDIKFGIAEFCITQAEAEFESWRDVVLRASNENAVYFFERKYQTYRVEISIIDIQPGAGRITQYKANEEQFRSLPISIWNTEDILSMTCKELSSIVFRTLRNRIRKST